MASFPPAESITSCPKLVNIEMSKTGELDPFALYTLVKLGDPKKFRDAVLQDDDMDDELSDQVQFPPTYDFTGKTLKDVVDYHFSLSKDKEAKFDYTHFIVAIHKNYDKHGVLVVDLLNEYYDDFEAVPGIARAPLQSEREEYEDQISAFAWCVNLQIANMGNNIHRGKVNTTVIDVDRLRRAARPRRIDSMAMPRPWLSRTPNHAPSLP